MMHACGAPAHCREGEAFRCLGAGTRVKKIMIVGVKVYSAACYVEVRVPCLHGAVAYTGTWQLPCTLLGPPAQANHCAKEKGISARATAR